MKLEDLNLFVSVVDEGSMSLAANVLDLSQPNVSRSIRALEKHLNTSLLKRTGRGVEPTDGGKRFYGFARNVLEEFEATQNDIRKLDGSAPEKLRILIPRHTGRLLVPAIFRKFHNHFPDVRLEIEERQATEANKALITKECDAAIFYENSTTQYSDCKQLFTESLYITGHIKHLGDSSEPLTLSDCAKLPLLMFSNSVYSKMVLDAFSNENLQPTIIRQLENKVAIMAFAIEGDGVAIQAFSNFVNEYENEEIQARLIIGPRIERRILGAVSSHIDRRFAKSVLGLMNTALGDIAEIARWYR